MLAFPPNYAIPISLVFIGVVSLFLYKPLRERLRPRRLLILALTATLVCFPVYLINYQHVSAYNMGSVILNGRTWDFTIWPGGVERIDDLSNIHVLARVYLAIGCSINVTCYLIDQNRPEIHQLEANYSDDYVRFRLPYLYTETGLPARWSLFLMNPNPMLLHVSIQSVWLEDSIEMARWSIEYNLYLPLAFLFPIWLALGVPLLILHRRTMKSQEFTIGLVLIIPAIGLGLVLVFLVPLFLLSFSPAFLLLIFPLSYLFRVKEERAQGPTIDIV